MDVNEPGFGDVGDPSEQFNRNEAISAVVDEGFLVEEEDDDYEDLYNDVNVGEGFLQSVRKDEDLGFRNEEVEKKLELHQPLPPLQTVAESNSSMPGLGSGDGAIGRKFEKDVGGGDDDSRVFGRVEGFQNVELSGKSELGKSLGKLGELEEQTVNNSVPNQGIEQRLHVAVVGSVGNSRNHVLSRQGGGNVNGGSGESAFGNGTPGIGARAGPRPGSGGGGGMCLIVRDLHWWTTDAELEAELCKYGHVKEVKFFDEKASGKSKGYCQVDFYDQAAAIACKDGMNGHIFNGRPCVVAFASPFSIKRMGDAQNRSQQMTQTAAPPAQARRGGGGGDAAGKVGSSNNAVGGNYQGVGDNNRGYGRGNWGRGNVLGMGNWGPNGPMRNRAGGMSGRGIMGNTGNGFGQVVGAAPPLLHTQNMMARGFDPGFGAPMGRVGSYGGFPGAQTPPFSGILSSFPPMGSVGLPGVAPHVNPAFFGRGMPMNGMGMMPTTGIEGHNMGMWSDSTIGRWVGDEHAGRTRDSGYGEEAVSDHQYRDADHDNRGDWPNTMKDKDRSLEREWSGSSDRRYRDEREPGYDRDMPGEKDMVRDRDLSERKHREERDIGRDRERDRDRERSRDRDIDFNLGRDRERDRDRHKDDRDRYDHRYRDCEPEYEGEWERGRSSGTHSKPRLSQEEDYRSRSRDAEYGKRRP
ncbi:hypothetical protein U1Q18_023992 [Sarracenia purpurea var. burkii]